MQDSSATFSRSHCLRLLLRVVFLAAVFVSCSAARLDAQPPSPQSYGPYSIHFLAGGPAVTKNLAENDALLAPHAIYSLSFWFRSHEPVAKVTLLAGVGEPDARDGRFLALDGQHLVLWTRGTHADASSAPLDPNRWHHALLTSNGVTLSLFADGQLVSHCPAPGAPAQSVLRIGPRSAHTEPFGGDIAYLQLDRHAFVPGAGAAPWAVVPDFSLPTYEDASPHWPLQTHAQAGYSEPQDPSTLPRSRAPFGKPAAKPLHPSDLRTRLDGANPWTIAGGWKLQAEPAVRASAAAISTAGFDAHTWYDAAVPGTVLTTLVDRGVYPDPDYGLNNMAIPESLAHQDYWYRVEFTVPASLKGQRWTLTFEGINYAAEVWLNGEQLGTITGAFQRGRFDVTACLRASGTNALAVRVSPPPHPGIAHEQSLTAGPGENGGVQVIDGPTFAATEGWDWIPGIRDRNTGIWQDVVLSASGPVTVGDLNVITTLPGEDRSEADVEIEVPLQNVSSQAVEGDVTAAFDDVKVVRHAVLAPGESLVRFTPAEFAQLRVSHPRLWWPNGYGEPALHRLQVSFSTQDSIGSRKAIDFGMREVSYELSVLDASGHLRRMELLPARTHDSALSLIDTNHAGIRQIVDPSPDLSAKPQADPAHTMEHRGWVYSLTPAGEHSASVRAAAPWLGTDLVIKVNGVRIAARGGNWGMDDSRKRVSADRLEPFFRLHRDAHLNIIRNWMGQDTEEAFYKLADQYGLMVWNDFWESTQDYNLEAEDPALFLANARDTILRYRHHPSIVVWCGRNEGVPQPIINAGLSELVRTLDHTRYYTGSSNQVDLRGSGPYQLEPLSTYYRINRGFSVELGIPSVPTLEGMKAFLPAADRWPISDTWAYHDWHQKGGGAVVPYLHYMDTAFGPATSFADFERKAQMIDYAAHRAIFEGFAAHLWQPNSGRLLWMTQPAWPSLEWNILGSDYDTQSSFYGVQKACEPVHAQLNLTDGSVDLINLGEAAIYSVQSRVVGLDGRSLFATRQTLQAAVNARTAVTGLQLANLAAGHAVLVELRVTDASNKPVSVNLYWWAENDSTLRELNALAPAQISASARFSAGDAEEHAFVTLKNTGSTPALLIKMTLENSANGERILPAFYSENYVSLLPGEERAFVITFPRTAAQPRIALRGWNLAGTTVTVQ